MGVFIIMTIRDLKWFDDEILVCSTQDNRLTIFDYNLNNQVSYSSSILPTELKFPYFVEKDGNDYVFMDFDTSNISNRKLVKTTDTLSVSSFIFLENTFSTNFTYEAYLKKTSNDYVLFQTINALNSTRKVMIQKLSSDFVVLSSFLEYYDNIGEANINFDADDRSNISLVTYYVSNYTSGPPLDLRIQIFDHQFNEYSSYVISGLTKHNYINANGDRIYSLNINVNSSAIINQYDIDFNLMASSPPMSVTNRFPSATSFYLQKDTEQMVYHYDDTYILLNSELSILGSFILPNEFTGTNDAKMFIQQNQLYIGLDSPSNPTDTVQKYSPNVIISSYFNVDYQDIISGSDFLRFNQIQITQTTEGIVSSTFATEMSGFEFYDMDSTSSLMVLVSVAKMNIYDVSNNSISLRASINIEGVGSYQPSVLIYNGVINYLTADFAKAKVFSFDIDGNQLSSFESQFVYVIYNNHLEIHNGIKYFIRDIQFINNTQKVHFITVDQSFEKYEFSIDYVSSSPISSISSIHVDYTVVDESSLICMRTLQDDNRMFIRGKRVFILNDIENNFLINYYADITDPNERISLFRRKMKSNDHFLVVWSFEHISSEILIDIIPRSVWSTTGDQTDATIVYAVKLTTTEEFKIIDIHLTNERMRLLLSVNGSRKIQVYNVENIHSIYLLRESDVDSRMDLFNYVGNDIYHLVSGDNSGEILNIIFSEAPSFSQPLITTNPILGTSDIPSNMSINASQNELNYQSGRHVSTYHFDTNTLSSVSLASDELIQIYSKNTNLPITLTTDAIEYNGTTLYHHLDTTHDLTMYENYPYVWVDDRTDKLVYVYDLETIHFLRKIDYQNAQEPSGQFVSVTNDRILFANQTGNVEIYPFSMTNTASDIDGPIDHTQDTFSGSGSIVIYEADLSSSLLWNVSSTIEMKTPYQGAGLGHNMIFNTNTSGNVELYATIRPEDPQTTEATNILLRYEQLNEWVVSSILPSTSSEKEFAKRFTLGTNQKVYAITGNTTPLDTRVYELNEGISSYFYIPPIQISGNDFGRNTFETTGNLFIMDYQLENSTVRDIVVYDTTSQTIVASNFSIDQNEREKFNALNTVLIDEVLIKAYEKYTYRPSEPSTNVLNSLKLFSIGEPTYKFTENDYLKVLATTANTIILSYNASRTIWHPENSDYLNPVDTNSINFEQNKFILFTIPEILNRIDSISRDTTLDQNIQSEASQLYQKFILTNDGGYVLYVGPQFDENEAVMRQLFAFYFDPVKNTEVAKRLRSLLINPDEIPYEVQEGYGSQAIKDIDAQDIELFETRDYILEIGVQQMSLEHQYQSNMPFANKIILTFRY